MGYNLLAYIEAEAAIEKIVYHAEDTIRSCRKARASLLRMHGIGYHDREPGFNGYYHDELEGYFATPQDIIRALNNLETHNG